MLEKGSIRPYGITGISVLLLTLGAQMTGLAILNLATDMRFLASPGGASMRYLMFALVFTGLTTAGFGIALYEGFKWARSASLFMLAFFVTLKIFSMASQPFRSNLISAALCAVCGCAILYLSMPEAKQFLSVSLKKEWGSSMEVEPARALQRAL